MRHTGIPVLALGMMLLVFAVSPADADELSDLFTGADAVVDPVPETPAEQGPSLLEEYQAAQEKFSFSFTLTAASGLYGGWIAYPDFFDPAYFDNYTYSHVDIITMDSRTAFVISFVQKEHINDPLYKGLLYIDDSSFAILGADFQINQIYVTRASRFLVVKSSAKYRTKPVSVKYSVR
ncbi:MAG: hypothetical protein CVV51_14495, partial [Spirochaetae bacterium HGW-Spirochaetae-7]